MKIEMKIEIRIEIKIEIRKQKKIKKLDLSYYKNYQQKFQGLGSKKVNRLYLILQRTFSLIKDKGTYILVTQGTGEEKKLKAKTSQDATQELVKKGYRES